jgi:predicted amidohydrolase/ribosomal protein S18 acetylase RimI-like enzyme
MGGVNQSPPLVQTPFERGRLPVHRQIGGGPTAPPPSGKGVLSMKKVDLADYETRIVLRQLKADDFEAAVDLQKRCFPNMVPWTREQFDSQLGHFPEGQMCIEIDGELAASSSSLIVDYSDYSEWSNWKEVSDNGFIHNHDSDGDTLYGIEIQVAPEFRGMKLARRLYDRRKQLCRERNLARMIVGGRIPGYAPHKGDMSANEYVDRVIRKALYDPVLTAQLANGFSLKEIIPDYFPADEDSAGYATFLEWPNLEYRKRRSRRTRRGIEPVRVATVQYEMRAVKSFDDFARQVEFFVDVSSDAKADFVLFPELFTLQLLCLVKAHQPGKAARELANFTDQYLDLFSQLALRYNINIIGGSQFTLQGDHLFNVAYLFRRDGTLESQHKIHATPNEKRWWGVEGGQDVAVLKTDCGPIAILICYDVEFPELTRRVVDQGARILFVPFNTYDRHGYLRVRICTQARCIENQVYAVTSGCTGNLPFVENADLHYAQSGIFTPCDIPFARDGVAAEASENIETVVIHDLDFELLRRARVAGSVRNLADRRGDLYSVKWREGPLVSEDATENP